MISNFYIPGVYFIAYFHAAMPQSNIPFFLFCCWSSDVRQANKAGTGQWNAVTSAVGRSGYSTGWYSTDRDILFLPIAASWALAAGFGSGKGEGNGSKALTSLTIFKFSSRILFAPRIGRWSIRLSQYDFGGANISELTFHCDTGGMVVRSLVSDNRARKI